MSTWNRDFLCNLVDMSEFNDVPFKGQNEQPEASNEHGPSSLEQGSSRYTASIIEDSLAVVTEDPNQTLDTAEQSERNACNSILDNGNSFGNENKNYNCDSIQSLPFAEQNKHLESSNRNNEQASRADSISNDTLEIIFERQGQNLDMSEQSERNESNSYFDNSFGNEKNNCDSIQLISSHAPFEEQNKQLDPSNRNNEEASSYLDTITKDNVGVIFKQHNQDLYMREQSGRNEANLFLDNSFRNENKQLEPLNENVEAGPSFYSVSPTESNLSIATEHQLNLDVSRAEQFELDESTSFLGEACETEDKICNSDLLQSSSSSERINNLVIKTLKEIQDETGATLMQIKKYLSSNWKIDVASMDNDINQFIRTAVSEGVLVKPDRFRYFLASEGGVPQKKTRAKRLAPVITYPKRQRRN